jgi:hypothetical protein
MAIRGTLISPTNILLEHPIFQCPDGPEYVIVSKKEYDRTREKLIWDVFYLGMAAGACILVLVVAVAFLWSR